MEQKEMAIKMTQAEEVGLVVGGLELLLFK